MRSTIIIIIKKQMQKNSNSRAQKIAELKTSLKSLPLFSKNPEKLNFKSAELAKLEARLGEMGCKSKEQTSENDQTTLQASEESDPTRYNSILQQYELLEKIGEGANAVVYKCLYKGNKRFYAAKKFKIEQEHVQELKRNFILMKEMNHPAICKHRALYFDVKQRSAFLVMDYLPYPSLADRKPQSEAEVKLITLQLISAIQYLHNRNLCHRDIKPENILYDPVAKKIHLIDFGVSKNTYLRGSRRDMLTFIGTRQYLAPEMYIGGGYDQRVDFWALGVTVYKLITGKTPFQSIYIQDTVKNILKGEVSFRDSAWKEYSRFASSFVSKLLKRQEQRMSLDEAEKHLWLQEDNHSKCKLKRNMSFSLDLSESFRREMNKNMKHATSREEGCLQNDKILFKVIPTRNTSYFNLQDSEDEQAVVTPKTAGCIYNNPISKKQLLSFATFAKSVNAAFLDETQ